MRVPVRPAAAGIILCAGASRRLGYPKRNLRWGTETFLQRMVRLFRLHAHTVVIVSRPGMPRMFPECLWIENPDPERGMLSSLQCGLAMVPAATEVLFSPVDHAAVQEATLVAILSAAAQTNLSLVKPVHETASGHPVLVRGDALQALRQAPLSAIARDLLKAFPACRVPVPDPAVGRDVDTIEEYRTLCLDLQMPYVEVPTALPPPQEQPE